MVSGLIMLALLAPQQLSPDVDRFWAAARQGDVATLKAMLAKGVDVNSRFRYNTTALWHAASKGHLEAVKALLDAGADVTLKDDFFGGPLGGAAFTGNVEIVRLLIEKGATGRDTALTIAAQMGKADLAKVLLDKSGFNAETLSAALETATKAKHKDVVELLEKAGAKPPVKTVVEIDAETLKSYAGSYRSRDGMEFSFTVKDGALYGGNIFDDAVAWEAIDKTSFRGPQMPFLPPAGTVAFKVEGGKVIGFDLKRPGGAVAFQKVVGP